MGCGPWSGSCFINEHPLHGLRLDGFWMARHEVTQGQWKKVMGANPAGCKKGNRYPVEKVSWNDAQKFIQKFNARNDGKFRLPTESEWEFACRAGGLEIKFSWGNIQLVPKGPKLVNIWDETAVAARFKASGKKRGNKRFYDDGYKRTSPVGSFPPNKLGPYDMIGNVWEWMLDNFDENGYRKKSANNPIYQRPGSPQAIRCGNWLMPTRCSSRQGWKSSARSNEIGFRLVKAR